MGAKGRRIVFDPVFQIAGLHPRCIVIAGVAEVGINLFAIFDTINIMAPSINCWQDFEVVVVLVGML